MMRDEIVEEVRQARQQNAAKWNFDLQAILADARQRQKDSNHPIATFAVKKKKKP